MNKEAQLTLQSQPCCNFPLNKLTNEVNETDTKKITTKKKETHQFFLDIKYNNHISNFPTGAVSEILHMWL